jgi:cell division protein ZapA
MPQVEIAIGGRTFEVACQEGEEHYLHSAAAMLNEEAQLLTSQIGRMPEPRMLLMAGLMLADKTAVMEDKVTQANDRMAQLQARIDTLETSSAASAGAAATSGAAVLPLSMAAGLNDLAARAEALAEIVEQKAG